MTTSVTNTGASAATQALDQGSRSSSTVDYQDFLRLLIAQLKNQDPTKPVESTEFVSQMASFSAVEQQIATNARLDNVLLAMNLSQAGSIVGLKLSTPEGVEGVVKEVRVLSSGVKAVLDSGKEVAVGEGVVISRS